MNRSVGEEDTESDIEDLILAQRYRLGLEPPRQSKFRVVALVFYEETNKESGGFGKTAHKGHTARSYVVGTNDEPCSISGSICAERAALLQLRFIPQLCRITKVVIVTDAKGFISPGMLCREFLSSHPKICPKSMPLVLGGSMCSVDGCGLDISGCQNKFEGQEAGENLGNGPCKHDFRMVRMTLLDLYPNPSPYTRLSSQEAVEKGKLHMARIADEPLRVLCDDDSSMFSSFRKGRGDLVSLEEMAGRLLDLAVQASNRDNRDDLHPIKYGAAVMFSDWTTASAHHKKALEYGCSLDAVGQLAQAMDDKCGGGVSGHDGNVDGGTDSVRPVLLIQSDQYGVIHAPFAIGRAFLAEHGYGDCHVAVLEKKKDAYSYECIFVKASTLAPTKPNIWA